MKPSTNHTRTTNFVILFIVLAAMIVALSVLLYWILTAAAAAGPELRRYLTALGCLVAAVLLFTALLLALRVVRYTAGRLKEPSEPFKPTEYEDVWAEAGRRLKPEDAPPIEGFEEEENNEY